MMKNKRGFSLVELTIAMACYAVLASAVVPIFISHFNNKAAQKTAYEILSIAEASKNYYIDNSSWPTSLEELKSSSYLDQNWMAENPWGNPYLISDNTMFLSISSQVPLSLVPNVKAILPVSTNNIDVVSFSIQTPNVLVVEASETFPVGTILAWSGSIADIPENWELADGTCSIVCPDLRDKFIVGAHKDNIFGDPVVHIDAGDRSEGGKTHMNFSHSHPGTDERDLDVVYVEKDLAGAGPLLMYYRHSHASSHSALGNTNILPPYYAVAFIIRVSL